MKRYHFVHITEFNYDGPVSESYNEVRLRPIDDERQSCLSFRLKTNPGSRPSAYRDGFGNWAHHFNVLGEHRRLTIEADSVVLMDDAPPPTSAMTLSVLDACRSEIFEEHYDYLIASEYVPHPAALGALVESAEKAGGGTVEGFAKAAAVTIHGSFRYQPGATHVQSSVHDSLRLGAGVCQDFAHLLLAVLRRRGVPARYVSGYLAPLKDESGQARLEEVIGGQASHAWVEAMLPGVGWLPLDPTSGQLPGPRHVRVAYGRDYGDVAPVRGVYQGHAGQRLSVDVQLRPDVDGDGREQLNESSAAPVEAPIPEARPCQPAQQQQ